MTCPSRTSAFCRDAGDARTVVVLDISVFLRRNDSRSGASVSALSRAGVLGLETRLRALSGHPAPVPAVVLVPS